MPLPYERPTGTLDAELNEVAAAAQELLRALGERRNTPLPPEFPKEQLSEICRSLVQLPSGTAEGCRAPLDYARNRLPRIRSAHIPIDDKSQASTLPNLARGSAIDTNLVSLISSVSTAWEEYRRAAAEAELEPEPPAEIGVTLASVTANDAVAQGKKLDAEIAGAQKDLTEIRTPNSKRADDLQRQLEDVRGLNRIGSAEFQMPKTFGGLVRNTKNALSPYLAVIPKTASGMRVGVDVFEKMAERLHGYAHDKLRFTIDQIRKTITTYEEVVAILQGKPQSDGESQLKFSGIADACLYVLRKRGAPMMAKDILLELERLPGARQLILNFPKVRPWGRITAQLIQRRDRVGDVFNLTGGYWALPANKGQATLFKKARIAADSSADGPSHSERTRLGMSKAKQKGRHFGPKRAFTDGNADEAAILLGSGWSVAAVAEKFNVSPITVRNRVFKKTGKRFWRKGPRSKT